MIAASRPVPRPADARLLVVDRRQTLQHRPRATFVDLFRAGDLLIANDAATLPASLSGRHCRSGRRIEVRLAGHARLDEMRVFDAVLFGLGDFRMRTEDRPPPPSVQAGDRLELGPLAATVTRVQQPRLVTLALDGTSDQIWKGLARHGRPIQYSHLTAPLAVWDTWTAIAAMPAAFEPPSAGFLLDWRALKRLTTRGVGFATITHAAGLSSTGDPALDALLPFDEPYRVPASTAAAIAAARAHGGRIVAIGTTVVRALEHAATADGRVRAGEGMATQRIGPSTMLRIVDALLSGTHAPGESHHELLRAFVGDETLHRIDQALEAGGYRTHEFGDSVYIERSGGCRRQRVERVTSAAAVSAATW